MQAVMGSRLVAASTKTIAGAVAILALATACAGHPRTLTATPRQELFTRPADGPSRTSSPARAAPVPASGTAGTFGVGERQLVFAEPAHTGPTGESLAQRSLVVDIRYPRVQQSGGSRPAGGDFPLIVFAPGFMQCDGPYGDLLDSWASAGYVVAAVNFPRTDCSVGDAAYEPDLVNQPQDMSYALTRLLELSARKGDLLSGLVDSSRVAAAGQSDGGDTVAALTANSCCTDHRFAAVAVLSGAEWPPMPGRYFPGGAPPTLFVQGSADTINPSWMSKQLYYADEGRVRYYLDLFGATHTVPYWGTNPVERVVARVTLAFFDRYLLGKAAALGTMARDGDVPGAAALVSGGQPPPV